MSEEKFLKKYGIRATPVRRELFSAIFSLQKRHFSAEELVRSLRKKGKKVSRASTYRNIKLFSDKGVLRPLEFGKGFQMYEVISDDAGHGHLICLRCGKIIEFEAERLARANSRICKRKKFYPLNYIMRAEGLCRECMK